MVSLDEIKSRRLDREIAFSSSRSSGPGGQNVNKVNTKIELRFHINNSNILSSEEKNLIHEKLKSRINNDGELILASQESRSQLNNKETVLFNFYLLLFKAFLKQKKRIKTEPSKASVKKRLDNKKQHSEKKGRRKSLD